MEYIFEPFRLKEAFPENIFSIDGMPLEEQNV
jgi:hypothetical protein